MNTHMQKSFEKAMQELFKESFELFWSIIGMIACLGMVFGGIFYSQMAIVLIIGTIDYGYYFAWALAIGISALEVAGVKLFGNKERSDTIAGTNKAEHTIILFATILLFIFDVGSTIVGLYLAAKQIAHGMEPTIIGWMIIFMSGLVMGISEIFTGWLFRAIGTSYVSWKYAKNKYDTYNKRLNDSAKNGTILEDTQAYTPSQRTPYQAQGSFFKDYKPNYQKNTLDR